MLIVESDKQNLTESSPTKDGGYTLIQISQDSESPFKLASTNIAAYKELGPLLFVEKNKEELSGDQYFLDMRKQDDLQDIHIEGFKDLKNVTDVNSGELQIDLLHTDEKDFLFYQKIVGGYTIQEIDLEKMIMGESIMQNHFIHIPRITEGNKYGTILQYEDSDKINIAVIYNNGILDKNIFETEIGTTFDIELSDNILKISELVSPKNRETLEVEIDLSKQGKK